MEMNKIIGLKVVAIKGITNGVDKYGRRKKSGFKPDYILFDDKMTYIELEEQDPYDFHDCNWSAREIQICQNYNIWKAIMDDKNGNYPDADTDL